MSSYILHINKQQAETISAALEFYARIGMGQFEEIKKEFDWPGFSPDRKGSREIAGHLCTCLKGVLLPAVSVNAYNGITSPEVSAKAKICFDIHQVIRYFLAWEERPEGGITVDFDPPMKVSEQPFPIILLEKP